jgi:hypothetical protein
MERDLDPELVAAFQRDLLDAWERSGTLRTTARLQGAYVYRQAGPVPAGLDARGYKRLEPKGVFAAEPGVVYADWGGGFGRGLAEGEDLHLSEEFRRLLEEESGIAELEDRLTRAINWVRQFSANPLVLYSGNAVRGALFSLHGFVPAWRVREPLPGIPDLVGEYKSALIIHLTGIPEDELVVLDLRRFGSLIQYPPDAGVELPVKVTVERISPERARELHEAQPDLARDPATGALLDIDEAVRWYRLQVIVEVWERVRFEEVDVSSGLRIKLRGINRGS